VCESGLVFRLGAGKDVAYRAATSAELTQLGQRTEGLDEIVWLLIYREGPLGDDDLARLLPAASANVATCVERLVREGRVQRSGDARYTSRAVVLDPAESVGWEAGMLDHFQAVVRTLCARLGASSQDDAPRDVGGSTYSLRIWPGHPMEDEVRGALGEFRRKHTDLRRRIQDYNQRHPLPEQYDEVVIYGGQCILSKERRDNEESTCTT
jgi:hypothetical protein